MSKFPNARFIRVNPDNPGMSHELKDQVLPPGCVISTVQKISMRSTADRLIVVYTFFVLNSWCEKQWVSQLIEYAGMFKKLRENCRKDRTLRSCQRIS